jgi:hypothetical protein
MQGLANTSIRLSDIYAEAFKLNAMKGHVQEAVTVSEKEFAIICVVRQVGCGDVLVIRRL